MGFKNGEFSFHIWHTNPKTGVKKWCGQFYDDKSALKWKKSQTNPDEYRINNLGPVATERAKPEVKAREDAEYAAKLKEREERYERLRRGEVEVNTRPATSATRRMTVLTKEAPATPAVVTKPKRPETAEERRLKDEAAKVLDQHKQDEAADLEQGINN